MRMNSSKRLEREGTRMAKRRRRPTQAAGKQETCRPGYPANRIGIRGALKRTALTSGNSINEYNELFDSAKEAAKKQRV